jgi:uncharacterized protein (DUF1810 family)
MEYNFTRFLDAQNQVYLRAFSEIKKGKKESHWMEFIFPQMGGLADTEAAHYYAIADLSEASAYLAHPVLGKHLVELTSELLAISGKSVDQIFGHPDDLKLHASMTLFAKIDNSNPIFEAVLTQYFDRKHHQPTLALLAIHPYGNDTI